MLTKIVFLSTTIIVLLSLVSVIFPALIINLVSSYERGLNSFEIGPLALAIVISNFLLFSLGFLYYKKKLPRPLQFGIEYILNFEISGKIALIIGVILLLLYIGFSIEELWLNENDQWPDYQILDAALKIWPYGETDDVYIKEQRDRYVRMFLLSASLDYFQNIKILPFVASILLVVLTYFFTFQIIQKRFAGIVSMLVLLQSYTFLEYDTIAVYENFWVLLYVFSLYAIYKKLYLSPISYFLSLFTKAFVVPFFPMSIFYICRAKISKRNKILTIVSYGIVIGFSGLILLVGESVYGDLIRIDLSEFLVGFSAFSYQLRFDSFLILTIFPLVIGLFFVSIKGIKEADSIAVLILGSLLVGPVLSLFTDFYFILPYRFVPLIVFFSIGVGLIFSKKIIR